MAVVTQYPKLAGEWLKHELDPELNREEITIAAGAGNLVTGTVLGQVTATKKWKKFTVGAVDGTEVAKGCLLHGVDASGASDAKAVRVSGNAKIAPLELSWDATVTTQVQKDAALAQLATLGFKTTYQA